MLRSLRALMSGGTFTSLLNCNLASEALTGSSLLAASRRPLPTLPRLGNTFGPLQAREPRTFTPARLRLVTRLQALQLGMSEPTGGQKRPHPDQGDQGKPNQPKAGRKKKTPTPEMQVRMDIHAAAKHGDVQKALATYDKAIAEGIRLTVDSYASLLYLCSGGEDWEALLGSSPSSADAAATSNQSIGPEVLNKARQMLQHMQQADNKLPPNEMCFTALARIEALSGNAQEAFNTISDMRERKLIPRLRSFTPALAAFAEQGDYKNAFLVDAAVTEAGLELTEPEYARLIQACAHGASWEQAKRVLTRMGSDLGELQPSTLAHIQAYFKSQAALKAFESRNDSTSSAWEISPCTVDGNGTCSSCGGTLQAVDLTEEEYASFKDGVAAIAKKQERQPNDFEKFKVWLDENGPFHAVIDAANIAFFGQNFESGGFSFTQIGAVVNHMRTRHSDLNLLVLLHTNRTKGPAANREESKKLLTNLQEEHSFYATPLGSNDDWYWIYAAVAAGSKGLLVTNDEMRDHIFQLLTPKFFLKWKQRHQMKYQFGTGGLILEYPPVYTTCVQELDNGSWVFPAAEDGGWVCAKPAVSND